MTLLTKANAGNTVLAGTVGGGGMLFWLGQNAPAIGAIAVIIGLLSGIWFKWSALQETKRHNREIENKRHK